MHAGKAQHDAEDSHHDSSKMPTIGVVKEKTQSLDDWTDNLPVTEGTKFFKSIDWSTSSLAGGACVYWGDEFVAIYNEVYQPMAGRAHPNLMGKPFNVGYPELWANIQPIFEQVHATGITTDVENIELFTERYGYTEETYFIGQFIPLRGDDGRVLGVYNTVYESTFSVISVRRRAIINAIAAIPDGDLAKSNNMMDQIFQANGRDVPMALLYSLDEGNPVGVQMLQLRLNLGVKYPEKWVPVSANIAESDIGIVPYMRSAHERGAMVLVPTDENKSIDLIPLLQDVTWAGFGELPKVLVIAPLISAGNTLGFMVLSMNPRREFNAHCRQFVLDLTVQIAATWASAFTAEQSKAREQRLIRNLEERERRIRYMAESAPVGMLQLTMEGSIAWANHHYYDMMEHSSNSESDDLPFLECFSEEDQPIIRNLWETLKQGTSADCQARLKRVYQPLVQGAWRKNSTDISAAWLLVQGFPLKDDGELELIMMCFTDISGPKWAESVQHQVAVAAEKSKRQQEEFIDITSHEMRNPLSAIMQSAQAITAGLQGLRINLDQQELLTSVSEAIEAADTILSCGVYQKRIIDDVLMLSRLENEMLTIAPAIVNPVVLVSDTLKMLEGDARASDIQTTIIRDKSLRQLDIETILCDPSRIAQILTNLLSNSFKFTRNERMRLTEVTCGVSQCVPSEQDFMNSFQWSSTGKDRGDLSLHPEWGEEEVLYLYFMIRDTGSGMTQVEVGRLFARFSQATKTTHVKHGGSGLGLYISRELAEKHGGQIGVQSEPGKGSTFAFYVKGRRVPTKSQTLSESVREAAGSPGLVSLTEEFQFTLGIQDRYEVLLVEDNLINQRVLSKQLGKAGCIVHTADDGVEALELFKRADQRETNGTEERRPRLDVILMDWNMPNLDGVSCTRLIRSSELEKRIEKPMIIIGITANARTEQLLEAQEAGMDDVLSKPFLVSDLMMKIRFLVKK